MTIGRISAFLIVRDQPVLLTAETMSAILGKLRTPALLTAAVSRLIQATVATTSAVRERQLPTAYLTVAVELRALLSAEIIYAILAKQQAPARPTAVRQLIPVHAETVFAIREKPRVLARLTVPRLIIAETMSAIPGKQQLLAYLIAAAASRLLGAGTTSAIPEKPQAPVHPIAEHRPPLITAETARAMAQKQAKTASLTAACLQASVIAETDHAVLLKIQIIAPWIAARLRLLLRLQLTSLPDYGFCLNDCSHSEKLILKKYKKIASINTSRLFFYR